VVILYSEIIAWSFPFYECNEHSPFYFQPAKHAKYTKGLFSKKVPPSTKPRDENLRSSVASYFCAPMKNFSV